MLAIHYGVTENTYKDSDSINASEPHLLEICPLYADVLEAYRTPRSMRGIYISVLARVVSCKS